MPFYPAGVELDSAQKKGEKKSIPEKFPQILVYRSNSCKYLNSASTLLLYILIIKKKATRKYQ